MERINEYREYLIEFYKQVKDGIYSSDSEPLTFYEKYGYTSDDIKKETALMTINIKNMILNK